MAAAVPAISFAQAAPRRHFAPQSGAKTDVEKTQKRCDWIVASSYRGPQVRGCADGDIKTLPETGNLGGQVC